METDVTSPVERIGRYELREPLGSGGFATVYRAYDPVLDREVALKVVHTHLGADPKVRERFVREGRALARVRHPSVVQVHDAGEARGAAYIAMDLIEGRPLDILLRDGGPLPLARVLGIADQIAAGLAAVHARNVIHRDVKPANIIYDASTREAVLGDLGLARSLDVSTITTSDAIMGTPGYLAPEQVDPDGEITTSTDVYQLGATIFALLAGRAPFAGKPAQVLYAVMHAPAPDLHALNPTVPHGVASVVARALAKDPASRPADALRLAHELRAAAEQAPVSVPGAAIPEPLNVVPWRDTEPDRNLSSESANRAAAAPSDLQGIAEAPPAAFPPPRHDPRAPVQEHPRGRAGRTSLVTRQVPRESGDSGSGRRGERPTGVAEPRRRRTGWIPAGVAGVVLLVLGAVAGFAMLARSGDGDGQRARVAESTPMPGSGRQAATWSATTEPAASPTPGRQPSPAATTTATAATPAQASPTPSPSATPSPPSTTVVPVSGSATPDGVAAAMAADIAARGYEPRGSLVSVSAGSAGDQIYAQVGVRRDCSSDRCEKVFIRWNDRYLGTDTRLDSYRIVALAPGRLANFTVTYEDREAGGAPVTVVYTCTASRCTWSQTPPGHPPTG